MDTSIREHDPNNTSASQGPVARQGPNRAQRRSFNSKMKRALRWARAHGMDMEDTEVRKDIYSRIAKGEFNR